LSQNTTDKLSWPAFLRLKAAFPTWEAVRLASPESVAEPIKSAGLSVIKTARIQAILQRLHDERSACCLEHLRELSDDEVKAELSRHKGVGPKTVACVLLFALKRADFPCDVHVFKIAAALGWLPERATRETCYSHLNARVPSHLKHELHVLLVEHGKAFKNDVGLLRAGMRERMTRIDA
jgi:endonuclease-3